MLYQCQWLRSKTGPCYYSIPNAPMTTPVIPASKTIILYLSGSGAGALYNTVEAPTDLSGFHSRFKFDPRDILHIFL